MSSAAYLFTTPERAKDMKQKPVYILNVASDRTRVRSFGPSLEEAEAATDETRPQDLRGLRPKPKRPDVREHVRRLHAVPPVPPGGHPVRRRAARRGAGLLRHGHHHRGARTPRRPRGGNAGAGRTRFWMHTDSIQQIQGRAGDRQISKPAEIGVSGGPTPTGGNFTVWSSTPG